MLRYVLFLYDTTGDGSYLLCSGNVVNSYQLEMDASIYISLISFQFGQVFAKVISTRTLTIYFFWGHSKLAQITVKHKHLLIEKNSINFFNNSSNNFSNNFSYLIINTFMLMKCLGSEVFYVARNVEEKWPSG